MTQKNIKKIAIMNIVMMFVGIGMQFNMASQVHAANLTNASMRPDRMAISLSTNYLVVVTPATVGTEASTKVNFAAGYDVTGATATTTGIPATYHGLSLTAVPTIGTAAISGQNVTVPHGDLTVGTAYAFIIQTVVNPGTTGQKSNIVTTQTSAPATIDSSSVTTYIVSDNGASTDGDQIVVTASVAPTYTLILGANTDSVITALGTVESGTGVLATATTNANNGHVMWLKASSTTGLDSATTATSIPYAGTAADATPTTITAGTEGVVIDVNSTTNGSGTLTVAAEFNGATTAAGGTPNTAFQEIASATTTTTGDAVTIIPRVAISTTTQAANDYTATYTVVGAGNF